MESIPTASPWDLMNEGREAMPLFVENPTLVVGGEHATILRQTAIIELRLMSK